MNIKLIKFPNFVPPLRCFYNDSGADVFSAEDVVIPPHSVRAIKTGVGVVLPDGYDAVLHCKSGLSKKGLWASNAPIDAGYRGEIHAILHNTTEEPFEIKQGQKIGQIVVRPVIYATFVDELSEKREDGAFGSTGV